VTTIFEYTQANVLVIPQALFAMEDVTVLGAYRDSAIFYKNLDTDLKDIAFYTNTPCFIYIESGSEVITDSNNHTVELFSGAAIFLPQGLNLNSDFVKKTASLKAYLAFFDHDVVTHYLSKVQKLALDHEPEKLFCTVNNANEFLAFFESIQLSIAEPAYLTAKLEELLHLIAWRVGAVRFHSLLSRKSTSEKENLTRLLNSQDIVNLTVNDLAKISGQSISTLNREFKRLFNETPKRWLLTKKLAYAKDLLERKNISVTEVAFSLGYENVSSFIKVFKDKYGVTPKQI